jgi:hypothetical protein
VVKKQICKSGSFLIVCSVSYPGQEAAGVPQGKDEPKDAILSCLSDLILCCCPSLLIAFLVLQPQRLQLVLLLCIARIQAAGNTIVSRNTLTKQKSATKNFDLRLLPAASPGCARRLAQLRVALPSTANTLRIYQTVPVFS